MTKTWCATLIVIVMAVGAATACTSTHETCQSDTGARICLVAHGQAYTVTGQGLQPGSQVHVAAPDPLPPTVAPLHADDHGHFPPPGGNFTILRDTKPVVATIEVTTSIGKTVTLRFPVPAAHR